LGLYLDGSLSHEGVCLMWESFLCGEAILDRGSVLGRSVYPRWGSVLVLCGGLSWMGASVLDGGLSYVGVCLAWESFLDGGLSWLEVCPEWGVGVLCEDLDG
jgi:hypothetical protein